MSDSKLGRVGVTALGNLLATYYTDLEHFEGFLHCRNNAVSQDIYLPRFKKLVRLKDLCR